MAISIGDALLKLKVDKKGFDRDMKGLSGAINKHKKVIGMAMVGMGVAAIGSAMASIKAFADMGDAVHKMALRTEFSTEALSEWKHVAEISGTSLESLEKGVKKMSKTIVDASDGMATYVRSFDRIGLSAEQLMELAPEEQFETIMLAIAELESPTLQAATAQDIFGRAGTELLPVMKAGADGIAKLRKEARDLGIVFDQEAAESAASFKDSLTRLEGALNGVKYTLARQLMPAMEAGIPTLEYWAVALGPIIENTLNWRAAQDKQLKMDKAWQDMQHQRFLFGNKQNNQYEQSLRLLESMLKNQGIFTTETEAVIERLKEEIKVRKEHEKAIEDTNEDLEAQIKLDEELLEVKKETTEMIQDAIKEMKYERSEAGRLRVGIDDVIKALHLMGKSNEYIADTLVELGDEQDDVLTVLKAFGLEALEVADILGIQTDAVDGLADSYKKLGEDAETTADKLEDASSLMTKTLEEYQRLGGYAPWVTPAEIAADIARAAVPPPPLPPGAPEWGFTGAQFGGIAMRPMLARVAEKSPEALIPLDRLEGLIGGRQMMTIIYEVDSRQMAKTIMPYAVGEIRLRTGVHI